MCIVGAHREKKVYLEILNLSFDPIPSLKAANMHKKCSYLYVVLWSTENWYLMFINLKCSYLYVVLWSTENWYLMFINLHYII
jgi:hypothetical protein